uniref:Lymphocyte antigen 96 n=1 Tax=Parastrongyloides trichosuri TaxID=131310 RepID=A0A0N5A606_PARTI
MLRILLLTVPIISSWPVPSSNSDGVHCYNKTYTILLNGSFLCHGYPIKPSGLELLTFEGVTTTNTDKKINLQGRNNNELRYNRTFDIKDGILTISASLKVFHSCDMFNHQGCNHLYMMKIPDSNIYCNGSMNAYYNFTAELSLSVAQSKGGCPYLMDIMI